MAKPKVLHYDYTGLCVSCIWYIKKNESFGRCGKGVHPIPPMKGLVNKFFGKDSKGNILCTAWKQKQI